MSDHYAYLETDGGFQVFDVGDPPLPELIGSYYREDAGAGLFISGSCAYVGGSALEALRVIDIHDPAQPQCIGVTPAYGSTQDLVISGNILYVASSLDFSVRNPG